jgi:hypothetical protein
MSYGPATIRVSKACTCGATMQATWRGDQEVGAELERAWAQLHHGDNHRSCSPTEAREARRRSLLWDTIGTLEGR